MRLGTREEPFIKQFLTACENGSWADAAVSKPDAVDRTNPAVDQFATRKSDGKTLAIEHTLIEPFVGDKYDFAYFKGVSGHRERQLSDRAWALAANIRTGGRPAQAA